MADRTTTYRHCITRLADGERLDPLGRETLANVMRRLGIDQRRVDEDAAAMRKVWELRREAARYEHQAALIEQQRPDLFPAAAT